MVINEQLKREFQDEISSLYPFLSSQESKEIIENMTEYWIYILQENIE